MRCHRLEASCLDRDGQVVQLDVRLARREDARHVRRTIGVHCHGATSKSANIIQNCVKHGEFALHDPDWKESS
eukprot:2750806-Pleurochrysis_carterae.AAC.5